MPFGVDLEREVEEVTRRDERALEVDRLVRDVDRLVRDVDRLVRDFDVDRDLGDTRDLDGAVDMRWEYLVDEQKMNISIFYGDKNNNRLVNRRPPPIW